MHRHAQRLRRRALQSLRISSRSTSARSRCAQLGGIGLTMELKPAAPDDARPLERGFEAPATVECPAWPRLEARRTATKLCIELLDPLGPRSGPLRRGPARHAILYPLAQQAAATHRPLVQLQYTRGTAARWTNKKAPTAPVRKIVVRDADLALQFVLAFPESDDDRRHVGGYEARCAHERDARRDQKIILKQAVHGIMIPHWSQHVSRRNPPKRLSEGQPTV